MPDKPFHTAKKAISNWSLYPVVESELLETANERQIAQYIQSTPNVIARGNARCYGDASLNANIISTRKLNKMLDFDVEGGVIECQAGVLLSDILDVIVPKGFFLPVTPGTKFITVGGAVASDVHGKNHHVDGCFSKHVISLQLMQADGQVVTCSPEQNTELFWQTCGGMGLTGVILSVRFKLKAIRSAYIRQESIKAANLQEIMQLFEESKDWTYTMAWIDCLSTGNSRGRSIMMRGEFAEPKELPAKLQKAPLHLPMPKKLNVPFKFPGFVLNTLSVRAFNFLYYNKQLSKQRTDIIPYDTFFYPLDAIHNWNRIYGKNGFVQYQFVIPLERSKEGLERILDKIAASGEGSFLTVLKQFGAADPRAKLTFPFPGYTLALDFKVSKTVFKLLDELDQIVVELGGRIYLTKDARMSKQVHQQILQQTYATGIEYKPDAQQKFISDQYRRLSE